MSLNINMIVMNELFKCFYDVDKYGDKEVEFVLKRLCYLFELGIFSEVNDLFIEG